jgi:tRNA-uridine 2-sulfurtransferase
MSIPDLSPYKGKRVVVGLSGGIDSSVSAYLMKEAGCNVTGVTMQIWDATIEIKDSGRPGCFGPGEKDDIEAAKSLADRLGIEHIVIPLALEYKNIVLEYFRSEYLKGRTPNPCVMCNWKLKFGLMLDKFTGLGKDYDYVATGHYARVSRDEKTSLCVLRKGVDSGKDQSYFLCRLGQDRLAKLVLPLGEMVKDDIRGIARKLGWQDMLAKKESQDFIETDDYSVLFRAGDAKPGPILDIAGKQVGMHDGIIHYTIGQRKGLGLGGAKVPVYVLHIDSCTNSIIVGSHDELYKKSMAVSGISWISGAAPDGDVRLKARIRQQHKEAPCLLKVLDDASTEVLFDEPQMSITPGQIAVLYDGDIVVGGGMIDKAY